MPEITTKYSSKIYYRKAGAGPCIMLLHGFPADGRLWRFVTDELAASFTVIVPELPGTGHSNLDAPTSLAEIAICIKDIFDNEGIEKVMLAGHSMGGYIAFEYAQKYADTLVGLSLVHSTPIADDEERKQNRLKAIAFIKAGGKKAFINQSVLNLFTTGFKQNNADLVKQQIEMSLEVEEVALINFYNAMILRPDYSLWLKKAIIPVQWVIGNEDNVLNYKKLLQNCHQSDINFVTFYPNCGHVSMLEMPEQLAADLKMFAKHCYQYHDEIK